MSARENLRAWIEERGIKIAFFAAMIEVRQPVLSSYLTGKKKPGKHVRRIIETKTGGAVPADSWEGETK